MLIKSYKYLALEDYFLRDRYPRKANKFECGILNLDLCCGDGNKWVLWFKNARTSSISTAMAGYVSTLCGCNRGPARTRRLFWLQVCCLVITKPGAAWTPGCYASLSCYL